jgi:hypothetical protein
LLDLADRHMYEEKVEGMPLSETGRETVASTPRAHE